MWYFGDHAALDFNSGSPVPVTGSALFTNEGCSSIADNSGNLLFYTDGITVWNKVHAVMPNGFGLTGNPSTTQSALIAPMPGSSTQYYIFTIDQLGGAMRYSVVDMTLAAGMGDVVAATKNVMLHPAVSEKQCGIQRCDGNLWIISHESTTNKFYADLVTPSGISPSVTSSVGTSHAGGGGGGTFNTVGQMKMSQQGDRIALAIRDVGVFEVFNFDINTGLISSPISINPGFYPVAYGVEFSPDGSKLYGGVITSSVVYQFNLLAGSAAAISASATVVGLTSDFTNSLQLGTDGKIYVAKSISQTVGYSYIDVINNPNALGAACSYVAGGRTLGTNYSLLGLPNLLVYSSIANLNVTGSRSVCLGGSTTLTANGGTSYTWSGGTTATTSSITVSPAIATDYYVSAVTGCGILTDTIKVSVDTLVNISVSGTDSICAGQSVVLTGSGSPSYVWSGGISSTASSVTVSPASTTNYYVTGSSNACGSDTDTLKVFVDHFPNVNVTGSTSVCIGNTTTLTASGASSYVWSGASSATTPSITVSPSVASTYYVSGAANLCGSDKDTINVTVDTLVNISVSGTDSICAGQTITLSATGSPSYTWSGGIVSGASSVTVSPLSTTNYYVSGITNACGTDKDTLKVVVDHLPNITVSGTTNICSGQSTSLTATGSSSYTWTGAIFAATSSITVSPLVSSIYYVTSASNLCGNDIDTVNVSVDNLVNINVSGPDSICNGQTITLSASGSPTYTWTGGISSASGSVSVSPSVTTAYYATGALNVCGSDTDTLIVHVENVPNITESGTTTICNGQSTTLTASGYSSYVWSGASSATTASISVSPSNTSTYYVTASSLHCGTDVDTVIVSVNNYTPAHFSYSFDECTNEAVFQNLSPGAQSYYWNFGNGISSSIESPVNNYQQGIYNITFITNPGSSCADSVQQTISVVNALQKNLVMPNVFTPNGDGMNDDFKIGGLSNCKEYQLIIYNRWGQKVFETDSPSTIFWDGQNGSKKEIVEGTYFYVLTIKEGTSSSTNINGSVSVLK
ncbi:MAG: T9SS type B sorting domain-containing protein [Bacteroidia bacterium]